MISVKSLVKVPAAGALVLSLSMAFANDSMIQFIRPVVKRGAMEEISSALSAF